MDAALATLIAAVIAAVAATTNAVLTERRATRLEEQKLLRAAEEDATRWSRAQQDEARRWQTAREDEAKAELRRALATLLERLAACGQEMHWLTWQAAKTPATMEISDVYALDTRISLAFIDFAAAGEEAIARLAAEHVTVVDYFAALHDCAGSILGNLSK